ncbi:DUF1040 family protein [Massilia sp. 9I]|uniref:DUF1040 family protein n=1 Tax=Massilia sp. 9I TaxID=2653152 RepID=UPI0012F230EB|nr:DUF1040 family protein [Massilia sp. 9I]VXB60840.1 conserved hypothetical protein [Massilia sp. 9I]
MRDPARIDEVLELLREVWTLEPDLRLGQLIYNAARIREPGLSDVFSIEDSSLYKGLVRYLEQIQVDRSAKSAGK